MTKIIVVIVAWINHQMDVILIQILTLEAPLLGPKLNGGCCWMEVPMSIS
jgi:hypothetical protein